MLQSSGCTPASQPVTPSFHLLQPASSLNACSAKRFPQNKSNMVHSPSHRRHERKLLTRQPFLVSCARLPACLPSKAPRIKWYGIGIMRASPAPRRSEYQHRKRVEYNFSFFRWEVVATVEHDPERHERASLPTGSGYLRVSAASSSSSKFQRQQSRSAID